MIPIDVHTGCSTCSEGRYCNGDPDLTRKDIPNSSVVKNMPKAAETGDCTEGYYCTVKATHPK
jgi:hypothetical protein